MHEAASDNPPLRIYVKKRENKITFRIKTGYLLSPTFNPCNYEIISKN